MPFSQLYVRGLRLNQPLDQEDYLGRLPVLRYLQSSGGLHFNRPVTFLAGDNGMGKSTLLEALAVALGFNPEGGSVNFNFSTRDSHSALGRYLTVVRGTRRERDGFFLRTESLYNLASNIDDLGEGLEYSYGGRSLHSRSHGEGLLSLVANRFGGHGLYLLDEPEAGLSPANQLSLLCLLHQLEAEDSQFIIATHSPILLAWPGAEIFLLSSQGVESVDFRDTQHYQLTRRFLNDPEGMLKLLFNPD